jgi:hypothetical protein
MRFDRKRLVDATANPEIYKEMIALFSDLSTMAIKELTSGRDISELPIGFKDVRKYLNDLSRKEGYDVERTINIGIELRIEEFSNKYNLDPQEVESAYRIFIDGIGYARKHHFEEL